MSDVYSSKRETLPNLGSIHNRLVSRFACSHRSIDQSVPDELTPGCPIQQPQVTMRGPIRNRSIAYTSDTDGVKSAVLVLAGIQRVCNDTGPMRSDSGSFQFIKNHPCSHQRRGRLWREFCAKLQSKHLSFLDLLRENASEGPLHTFVYKLDITRVIDVPGNAKSIFWPNLSSTQKPGSRRVQEYGVTFARVL